MLPTLERIFEGRLAIILAIRGGGLVKRHLTWTFMKGKWLRDADHLQVEREEMEC